MRGSTRDLTGSCILRMIIKNKEKSEAFMKKYTAPEMDIESLANDVVTASGEPTPTDTPEPTPCNANVYYTCTGSYHTA